MKVTMYKTVDVEAEVDVDIDDIIAEFSQRVGEADETYWRRTITALDSMTRIFAKLPDNVIAAFPKDAKNTLHDRLLTQAHRYCTQEE